MRIHVPHVLAVGAATVALAGITMAPAHAVPAADGTAQVLAAGGSDTTEDVMNILTAKYAANGTANPDGDHTVNIPVQANTDDPGFTVTGQGSCSANRTYVNRSVASPPTTYPAPNGSSDGKNALAGNSPFPTDNISTGCIDIARSSSPRGASDPATFKYFAYALDAVSWAHFDGGAAPASLSIDQIQKIYNCTFTNWNQVGGSNAAIHRYIPQAGSGTRQFFIDAVLGGNEPSTACGAVNVVQENTGNAVPVADRFNAILPYSVAQWVAQANQPDGLPDKRGNVLIGQQDVSVDNTENPVAGPDGSGKYSPNPDVVQEGGDFVGIRYVFNVTDTRLPDYGQVLRFIGTDGDGPGYLCNGNAEVTGTLTTYGFQPLSAGLDGSHCRVQ